MQFQSCGLSRSMVLILMSTLRAWQKMECHLAVRGRTSLDRTSLRCSFCQMSSITASRLYPISAINCFPQMEGFLTTEASKRGRERSRRTLIPSVQDYWDEARRGVEDVASSKKASWRGLMVSLLGFFRSRYIYYRERQQSS